MAGCPIFASRSSELKSLILFQLFVQRWKIDSTDCMGSKTDMSNCLEMVLSAGVLLK